MINSAAIRRQVSARGLGTGGARLCPIFIYNFTGILVMEANEKDVYTKLYIL